MTIEHVSDTARWVAVYRAMETERSDALFRDPFARQLAGARGEEIVRTMPRGKSAAWSMIVRTAVFDEIIAREVANGVDCVLNLAAGLDTRPFRMALPSTLRWVDVDFAPILDYKWQVLQHERSLCRYEMAPTDLTDANVRRALFARIGAEQQRVLVVAEGLLIYLTPADVAMLAADLHGQPTFAAWLFDLASPRLLKWMSRSWGRQAAKGNAPFQFAPAEGVAFFAACGWREREYRSAWLEAKRLGRTMPGLWLMELFSLLQTAKMRREAERMAGQVLVVRG